MLNFEMCEPSRIELFLGLFILPVIGNLASFLEDMGINATCVESSGSRNYLAVKC